MGKSHYVKMNDAALAEEGADGVIVLRGVLDPASLDALRVDTYQREMQPMRTLEGIAKGFLNSSVPDIDLGMRGGDFEERDGVFTLKDPVYVIDGFQRTSAARLLVSRGIEPVLGAAVRFNTTHEFEKERFRVLNLSRSRVSPNVMLRNMREEFPVIELLHDITTSEEGFPLRGRVCWRQSMGREHVSTGLVVTRAAGTLHAHLGAGKSSRVEELARSMQPVYQRIGRESYRQNVLAFFGVLHECWSVGDVVYKAPCTALRAQFMLTLARVFDEHETFWRGLSLVVEKSIRTKLQQFPTSDPSIAALCSGGSGPARSLLLTMLVDHINSGRRTGHLRPWPKLSEGSTHG